MVKSDVTGAIKREIDLIELAKHLGYEPVPHGTKGKYRSKIHDSMIFDSISGLFSWNSRGVGGSVIDLAMVSYGFSKNEAISHLRGLLNNIPDNQRFKRAPPSPVEKPATDFQLPEKSEQGYKRIFGYLVKSRQIDSAIVSELVGSKLIYQDVKGNVCFLGKDYDDTVKYCALRGTHSEISFRGETAGSAKEVGFNINMIGSECRALVVVEAPIDALSFMTMLKLHDRDPSAYGYLSLGGIQPMALLYHLEKHPEIERIYLCQDNDAAGDKSRQLCRTILQKQGFGGVVVDKPPKTKDFNDDLKELVQAQKQPERGIQYERTIPR